MPTVKKPQHSLRKKLMLLYIPLLLIPLVLFAWISSTLFRQAIEQRSLSSMMDHANVMAAQVDGVIEAANNCATYLSLDIDQLFTTQIKAAGTQNRLQYEAQIANSLSYSRLIFPQIHSIAFIDTRGKVFTTHPMLITQDAKEEASSYLDPLFSSAGNRIWFKAGPREWLNTIPEASVLTMGKKVWHTQTGKTIGYLFFNLTPDQLTQGFKQELATYHLLEGDQVLFLDDTTTDPLVQALNQRALAVASRMGQSTSAIEDGQLMVKAPLQHLNLSIIGYGQVSAHTPDLKQVTTLLLLAGAMTLSVLALFTWFSQRFIVAPLRNLHTGVEAISEGRFNYKLVESQKDELGLLAAHINRMSSKIESLMAHEAQMAQRRRTLELDRLQEQIKPHFLYNTLDIISKLMDMGDLKRAKRAAVKLANFYQRSLADGTEILSLGQEIQLIEDYMAIQNVRYGDTFLLKTSIPDHLLPLPIPKLTLQPLVENAIYHGLKLVDRPGEIHISAQVSSQGDLQIMVEDNGQGLAPQTLQALNQQLKKTPFTGERGDPNTRQDTETTVGFGLMSVIERLRLYYGPQARLELFHGQPPRDEAGLLCPASGLLRPLSGLLITITLPQD